MFLSFESSMARSLFAAVVRMGTMYSSDLVNKAETALGPQSWSLGLEMVKILYGIPILDPPAGIRVVLKCNAAFSETCLIK